MLPVAGWLVAACLGGANTVLLVAPPVLVVAALRLRGADSPAGGFAVLLLVLVGGCAPWALPALAGSARAAGDASTTAFGARADSAVGLVPTLLAGGGVSNQGVVPPGRSLVVVGVVSALAAVAVVAVGGRSLTQVAGGVAVLAAGAAALVVVAVQAWSVTAPAVAGLLGALPGGGLLRDGQKLLAWWVLAVACSSGSTAVVVLDRVARPLRVVVVLLLALAPVSTLPAAAWGAGGRLTAVQVPASYQVLRAEVGAAPAGAVGSLPWGQYRRYPWNGNRVSLDVLPRLLDRRVVQDDSLPLRGGTVRGEDPVAAAVTADLAAGADPFEALAEAGVGLVVVDLASGADLADDVGDAPGTEVVLRTDETLLVRVTVPDGAVAPPDRVSAAGGAGWVIGSVTVVLVVLAGGAAAVRRPRPAEGLGFVPTEG